MSMKIGFIELGVVLVLSIATLIFTLYRHRAKRAFIALTLCMAVAAAVTPANLATFLVIGTLMFTAFIVGGRVGNQRSPSLG